MRTTKFNRVAIALAVVNIAGLVGCGKSPTPPAPIGNVPGAIVPASCLPISGQIPFTANNIYFDWANIIGGAIPNSQKQVGTITIGGIATGGSYQRSGSDGTISMNITPNTQQQQVGLPYPTYPQGTFPAPSPYNTMQPYSQTASTANATGFLMLSQLVQSDIAMQMGSQFGINGGYNNGAAPYPQLGYPQYGVQNPGQGLCVSGIAINVGHYYTTIYGGHVYLYLNNTQHGYVLYF